MSGLDPAILRRISCLQVYISTIRHLFVFPFGKLGWAVTRQSAVNKDAECSACLAPRHPQVYAQLR